MNVLSTELLQADARLRPASLEEMKIIFARELVVAHLRAPPASWKATMPLYVEDLGHLPADLLQEGIRRCRRASAWFPTTADILAAVQDDMKQRIAERERIASDDAQKYLPLPGENRITPEEAEWVLDKYRIKRARERHPEAIREADSARPLSEVMAEIATRPKIPAPGTPEFAEEFREC